MRVLLVTGYCYPHGVTTLMKILAGRFIARGHEVEAYFYNSGSAQKEFLEICPSHFGPRQSLAQLLVKKNFDILHICSSILGFGFLRTISRVGYKGPILATYHGHDVGALPVHNTQFAFSTVSEFAASLVEQATGMKPSVVYNAIDEDVFSPDGDKSYSDSPILLWVGRTTDPIKDYPGLIAIAPLLIENGWKICVVDGIDTGNNYSENWLGSGFETRKGLTPHEMASLYRSTAASGGCLLVTSICESFGLAALEAMACGCPVVVPNAGGLSELVTHGQNGIVYERSEGRFAVAEKIKELRSTRDLRDRLIAGGIETVCDRFGMNQMVDRYANLYKHLINSHTKNGIPLYRRVVLKAIFSIRH
ncbi:MAG: glycosyltransferase family 4 protein [Armatimonadota bacterium]